MPDATAGHHSKLAYLWEDNGFASTPTDSDRKPFGIDTTLSTKEGSNNAVRLFNPDDPEAKQIIEQNFEGSFTVEFTLTNPWWLRSVIAEATSSGSAPTTHTFDGHPPDTMRILEGNTQTSTYRALEGCAVATATLTFNIPGTVDVSLDGAYANEDATLSSFTQPAVSERALSHHDSSLDRDGSTLSFVQSLTLTVNVNADMVQQLGDRKPVDYSPKQRNASLDYARIVTDDSDQKRAYGNADTIQSKVENTAPFTVVADNGKSGSDANKVTINLTNVFPDTVSRTGIGDPEADLQDELSEMAAGIDATATNSTSSAR